MAIGLRLIGLGVLVWVVGLLVVRGRRLRAVEITDDTVTLAGPSSLFANALGRNPQPRRK